MIVYIGVFLLLCMLSIGEILTKKKIFFFIAIISLILFAGLRYQTGYDFSSYQNFFDKTQQFSDIFFGGVDAEPGYLLINYIFVNLGLNYASFLLFYATVSMGILGTCLYLMMPYPTLILPYYYARFFLIRDMGQLRSSLVSLVFLTSLFAMRNKKSKQVILIALIGSFFHLVALFIIPAYFFTLLVRKLNWYKFSQLFLISLFCGILFYYPKLFMFFIPDRYIGYFGPNYSNGNWILNPIFIMQLLILVSSLMFIKRTTTHFDESFLLLVKLYMLSTLVLILFGPLETVAGRISTIFATTEIFIVPILINNLFKNKFLFLLVYFLFCSIIFVLIFIVSGAYQMYIPYKTIFLTF